MIAAAALGSAPHYPAIEPVTSTNRYRLEICQTPHGHVAAWDLNAPAPHALISGEDAAGRTAAHVVTAISALRRGFRVRIADPSRVEFAALRGWPGVHVARTLDDMVALIDHTHTEMTRRYERLMRVRSNDRPLPEILILDQWPQLHALATKLWNSHPGGRGEHPMLTKVTDMLLTGPAAGIHLLFGLPQPRASLLQPIQDHAQFRLMLATPPRDTARPLPHRGSTGVVVAAGHGTVHTANALIDVAVYRLPILNLQIPDAALSAPDACMRRTLFQQVSAAQALRASSSLTARAH